MIWVWVGIVVISAIVEAFSMDMTSIWITCGGIIGLIICAIFPEAIFWQILPFIIVTTLCIIFLRPITKKLISKKTVATNVSSFVGKKSKLISAITESDLGTLKINGIIWNAKTNDNSIINAGEEVEIIDIEGNKVIVKQIKNYENN